MKNVWNLFLPFFVYYVAHSISHILLPYLAGFTVSAFGGSYAEFMLANASTVNGLLNAFSLLIGMAAVLPMAKKELLHRKELMHGKGQIKLNQEDVQADKMSKKIGNYLILSILAASLALGMNILFSLSGLVETSAAYQNVADRQYGVSFAVGLVIYGILSPIAEEVVFRGLLYNRLKKYFPIGVSIAVCGILFGFYHGNLVQGLYGSIMGIAITYIYEVYGTLASAMLFHAVANLSVYVVGYNPENSIGMVSWGYCIGLLAIAGVILGWMIVKQKKKR